MAAVGSLEKGSLDVHCGATWESFPAFLSILLSPWLPHHPSPSVHQPGPLAVLGGAWMGLEQCGTRGTPSPSSDPGWIQLWGTGGCNPPPSLLLLLFLKKLQARWCPGKFLAAPWLLELGASLSQGPALQAATTGVHSQEVTQEKKPGGTF